MITELLINTVFLKQTIVADNSFFTSVIPIFANMIFEDFRVLRFFCLGAQDYVVSRSLQCIGITVKSYY